MPWYVVKTKPYKTIQAKHYFDALEINCFVPFYNDSSKGKSKLKPIITGYVFVEQTPSLKYNSINKNPFTSDVLKINQIPFEIPNDQMELMIHHIYSLYKKSDFKTYLPGDIIEISYGVFSGVRGKVIEIKNNKVVLYLNANVSKLTLALS